MRALAIVFRRCAAVANLFSPTKNRNAVWGAECLLLARCCVRRDAPFRTRLGAGSTDRRNTGVESLCWGFKLQGLSRPFVELTCHFIQIGL